MQGHKLVGVSLLVYHVGDKAVYLAVYERVRLEHVGVALVLIRGLAFIQNVTKRSEIVVIPIVIHKPLGIYQRNILACHACGHASLQSAGIDGFHHFGIVLNLYLVDFAAVVVVAPVTGLALLAPYLDDPAPCRVAGKQEIVVLQAAVTETLTLAYDGTSVMRVLVYISQACIF